MPVISFFALCLVSIVIDRSFPVTAVTSRFQATVASRSTSCLMSVKQATRKAINLKGSTKLVTEFFKYAVNTYVHNVGRASETDNNGSILFQRGVYPSDDFHMVKKYGQTVLVTQDLALENYLNK